ncbi:MAG: hypothetical protein ACJAZ3_000290 [Sphingobacteriales bacterium]|jgi:hypothetical protein
MKNIFNLLITVVFVTTSLSSNAQYCASVGTCDGSDFIAAVIMPGGIAKSTVCDGYRDFTATDTAVINQGSTISLSLERGNTGVAGGTGAVYIDWNQNGNFEDGEQVDDTKAGRDNYTFSVAVPADAMLGSTRMRVMLSNAAPASTDGSIPNPLPITSPCQAEVTYEVEDYTVTIAPACLFDFNATAPATVSGSTTGEGNDISFLESEDHVYLVKIPATCTWVFDGSTSVIDAKLFLSSACDAKIIGESNETGRVIAELSAGFYFLTVEGVDNAAGDYEVTIGQNAEFGFCYCKAAGAGSCADANTNFINEVTIAGGITNPSDCGEGGGPDGYQDHTKKHTAVMERSVGYALAMKKNNTTANYLASAFIDWNQNGSFGDIGEEVTLTPNSNTDGFDGTVTPPAAALFGKTTLRIRMTQSAAPLACGGQSRGEVEDYAIIVLNTDVNNGPVLNDDETSTFENFSKNVKVLANDFDPDGSLDVASLAVVAQPKNGSVAVSGDAIEYTPDTLYFGFDTFSYAVCDDTTSDVRLCDTAFVFMEVLNDRSTAVVTSDFEKLKVFPNPANDFITLRLNSFSEGTTVEIHSILGHIAMRSNLSAIETSLDVSELKSGTYILKVKGLNISQTRIVTIN